MATPFPASVGPSRLRQSGLWCRRRNKFDENSRQRSEGQPMRAALLHCVPPVTSVYCFCWRANTRSARMIVFFWERRALGDYDRIAAELEGGSKRIPKNGSKL